MILWPLFKQNIRSNYKILLVFMAVIAMYISVMAAMYDPAMGKALQMFAALMPQVLAMLGMEGIGGGSGTLLGFLSSYLYGFILVVFPMVFTIISANRLMARHVDRGSMAYLLAAPHSRAKVAVTQMTTLIALIAALILLCTLLTIAVCAVAFPGQLDVSGLLRLNVGLLLLQVAIASICFFGTCVCDETRHSLAIGAGIPVAFYLVRMLANMGGQLTDLKYATFFSLYDTSGLIGSQPSALWMLAALVLGGAALYAAGIAQFSRRDLML